MTDSDHELRRALQRVLLVLDETISLTADSSNDLAVSTETWHRLHLDAVGARAHLRSVDDTL